MGSVLTRPSRQTRPAETQSPTVLPQAAVCAAEGPSVLKKIIFARALLGKWPYARPEPKTALSAFSVGGMGKIFLPLPLKPQILEVM
ncbi:hypothetical protein D7X94_00675 [Acutalibacter sp. 1XD8-33]|nr:hypothetical protein D7X94_00675 [Acutalibacter sp. 1XD8-33]